MHNGVVFNFGEFKSRKCFIISISRDYTSQGQKNKKALKNQGFSWLYLLYSPFLVAGVGFEPHDLRVMSPTSCQTAPSRDICGAGSRGRTGTRNKSHGILSPGRLPIPPFRHVTTNWSSTLLIHYIT